jgi:uncharacterized protein YheU (UPF0270 family)
MAGRRDDDTAEQGDAEPIEVPIDRLSADALRAVVEEFVTRDGTDYGVRECDLAAKVEEVLRQLRRDEARIVLDRATGTVNIVQARPRRE